MNTLFAVLGLFAVSASVPVYTYQVTAQYPHDDGAFTQGLVYENGVLYEGTGQRGSSTLRRVTLQTGAVEKKISLDSSYFGEGITIFNNKIIQLTWTSRKGFVYDKETFEQVGTFEYPHEGWGITHDGVRLIVSDGTPVIRFWDPETYQETGRIEVKDGGTPVRYLNELEYVQGEIYANVWTMEMIARIDPNSGNVTGWINLAGILPAADRTFRTDVLNGIAYDALSDRLFVTGKYWSKLFEIRVVPQSGVGHWEFSKN